MKLGKEYEEMYLKKMEKIQERIARLRRESQRKLTSRVKITGKQKHSMDICLRRYGKRKARM